jgi:hypothetical protein
MGRDVVFYTVKEKYRFRMFDENELMNIFRPKGKDVTGGWRLLRNEELCNLCYNWEVNKEMARKAAEISYVEIDNHMRLETARNNRITVTDCSIGIIEIVEGKTRLLLFCAGHSYT